MPFFPDLPKPLRYLELASRFFSLLFLAGIVITILTPCEFYLFYVVVTKYIWALPLFLAIFFELLCVYIQNKKGLYPELYFIRFGKLLLFFLLIILLINIFTLGSRTSKLEKRDKEIKNYFSQAQKKMEEIHKSEGDYDSFSCDNQSIQDTCYNIDRMYTRPPLLGVICQDYYSVDEKEPLIVHDRAADSQGACIFTPLNQKGNLWYCLDSSGKKVETDTNPATPGFCIDGESAQCPEY